MLARVPRPLECILENSLTRPRAWALVVQVVNLLRIVNPPDALGSLAASSCSRLSDPLGRQTTSTYDTLGRLLATTALLVHNRQYRRRARPTHNAAAPLARNTGYI